jgi:PIN domain
MTAPRVSRPRESERVAPSPGDRVSVDVRICAVQAAHRDRSELNIYDAWIVAAALESGCDAVLSEDMQHSRKFAALRIANPFRSNGASTMPHPAL